MVRYETRSLLKLNLFIVKDELCECESYVFCGTGIQLTFSRFEVYRGQDLERDCLYLIDASKVEPDLILQDGVSFACYGTIENRILQYRRCSLIMLPSESLNDKSANRMSSIFAKYAQWSEGLLALAIANDGIRQIFKSGLIGEMFGNPVMMQTGNELFAIASGDVPDDYDGERWTSIVCQGSQDVKKIDYDRFVLEESIKEPFVFEQTSRYTLMATNMFSEGRFSGRLIHCGSARELTEGYMSLAAYFNSILEGVVSRNLLDGIVAHGESNVFVELLGAWHTDKAWLDMQLNSIGWRNDAPACLLMMTTGKDEAHASLARIVAETLSSLFPEDHVFLFKGDVLAVVRLAGKNSAEVSIRDKLKSLALPSGVLAVASSPFYDVSKLRSAYKQCRFLADSEAMSAEGRVRFYSDAFFRHFSISYGIDRDYRWLVHQGVALLESYDRKNDSSLVECLKVIIECGFRKKEAAEKLCVHHNTITYRIGRIREISGIDLDAIGSTSEDELFHILLSCKLIAKFG